MTTELRPVTTMRAVVQDSYGEDTLRLDTIARPVPAADEVLLRVHAVGVDRGVWHMMAGLPYPIRLAGYGVRTPKDPVRGREVAGRVEAVGADVTRLRVGDEVFGIGEGCFAEFACAKETKLVHRPAQLSTEQFAAIPVSGLTALQAVRDHGKVKAGQRVLVIGASGGVGTFAVQVAKAMGAEVTGVCRTSKVDLVRSLGVDHVVDYTSEEVTGTFDAVIDTGGHRTLRSLRRLLAPRGTLVIVGSETGGRLLGGTDRQIRAMLWSPFLRQTLKTFVCNENAADLQALADLVEAGKLTSAVERTYPLGEAATAVRHVRDGHAMGKVVVTI